MAVEVAAFSPHMEKREFFLGGISITWGDWAGGLLRSMDGGVDGSLLLLLDVLSVAVVGSLEVGEGVR